MTHTTRHHRPHRLLAALASASSLALMGASFSAGAGVVISQVYGGGGNAGAVYTHDFVELHNTGTSTVNLSGWSLQYGAGSATGSFSATSNNLALSGSIAPGGYFLVQMAKGTGGSTALPAPDQVGTVALGGAAGKVLLLSAGPMLTSACPAPGGVVADLVAYGTANTCFEGSAAAPGTGNAQSVIRDLAGGGCADTGDNAADFSLATAAPRNSASPAVLCSGTTAPAPAPAPAPGPAPATVGIFDIQGNGSSSPLVGRTVTTQGVVTKTTATGFFMQALVGDGNDATSDGILVYTATTPAVSAGQLVQVTGVVSEFATGGSTVTELTPAANGITVTGNGYSIAPTVVSLPVSGGLERYEGMLVTLTGPLTVNQNYFQARFGQLTLSTGGRLETPTNKHRAGSPEAIALAASNAARRVVLDDGSAAQNVSPTPYAYGNGLPRAGDQVVGSLTGVIDYGPATAASGAPGDYRILPLDPSKVSFSATNPRTAAPEAVGGNLKVASFNVLNFFTTFTNGNTASGQTGQGCSLGGAVSAANCRGADSLAEFTRQRAKIVEAMAAVNPDVMGLMEIQNNGSTAVQNLVDALNARVGAGTYAAVPDPASGTGSDAIKVAMVYKPAKLARVAASTSDADAINNRPPLAQTFALANGEKFTVVVNHLKSKGSCPSSSDADYAGNFDAGDGQGCWNARRVAQAARLRTFVAQLQGSSGSNDVVLVGDFNAYGQEDPIAAMTGSGYVDQIGRFNSFGYSYVFDGAAGRLDHALTTSSLSPRVTRALEWHINADESLAQDYNLEFKAPASCGTSTCPVDPSTVSPYRASDHDPVVMGLSLFKTIQGTAGRDVLVGTAGDDILIGGAGADTLTGGAGTNVFVYQSIRDIGDTITDFVPGKDLLDLRALLASLGVNPASALSSGVLTWVGSGNATVLQIDTDGSAGPAAPRSLVTLNGVSPAALVASRDLILQ